MPYSEPSWPERIWSYYSTLMGIAAISALFTFIILSATAGRRDQPVIVTSDYKLHTPRVPMGGDITFSLWRKSNESCPGTAVLAFWKVEEPHTVVSIHYPFVTPGYNSPPRLTITRQIPALVTPGVWKVRTGVDSRCPTRQRFDETGNFEVEVYRVDQ